MKSVCLEFKEVMSGTYTLTGSAEPPRRFAFQCGVCTAGFLEHMKTGVAELVGTLDMEGFADDVPIRGTLEIKPVAKRLLRYEFSFVANDGAPYQFMGEKNIKLGSLIASWTTLLGAVYDRAGTEVARATVKFDLKADFLPFLVSWKPTLA